MYIKDNKGDKMSAIFKEITKEKLQEIKNNLDTSKVYITYDKEPDGRIVLEARSLNGDKIYSFIINKIKRFNGGICMVFDNKSKLIAAETFLDSEINNTNSVLLKFINQVYWFYKQNNYMFDTYMMKNYFRNK